MMASGAPSFIPVEKLEALAIALQATFGCNHIDDAIKLTKGQSSAVVSRITVAGKPYLLRIVMRKNKVVPAQRELDCLVVAAEAGIAPPVLYGDSDSGIIITEFINEVKLGRTKALTLVPNVVRRVHQLPSFSRVDDMFNTTCMFLMHSGPAVDGFIRKFNDGNYLSTEQCNMMFAGYTQLLKVYPQNVEMVSSHNDLFKPDNMIFDGKRLWMVDWEAAFFNDRYVDLAAAGNLIIRNEAEETEYLGAYFGAAPNRYQQARFFLMCQMSYLFYGMVFLSLGKPEREPKSVGTLDEFVQRHWDGEINLEDAEVKTLFGRLQLTRFLENILDSRFERSLAILS